MKNESNIDWWEKVLADVPEEYADWFGKEEVFLKKHITKDAKVLEIGCGEGRSLSLRRKLVRRKLVLKRKLVGRKNNLSKIRSF